ncbi:putative Heterogeneous nuclear ribonucleoprotein H [Hypsibius exemplaris]|uniref:Heterogeneous nuclear ribonucleoprotein H n=1 Tax=Hypsibius exemplaris TaxID=2072580 RepID=A0A1W0WEU3_HYPEX|nr:putative Heterogeneous nuclear ribonucleoprotein H [Hypsibius exemplaris]
MASSWEDDVGPTPDGHPSMQNQREQFPQPPMHEERDVDPTPDGHPSMHNQQQQQQQQRQRQQFPMQHGESYQQQYEERDIGPQGWAVRIRGIPFQESEYTVHKWLQERNVKVRNGVLGIHFVYSDKRQWSGDAYAALQTDEDQKTAMAHDQDQMNHRYLEIFPCSMLEMEDVLKRTGYYRLPNDYTIRLRGLEFKVTREDIMDFFKGLDIASGLDGIFIIKNHDGRTTGEAYVLFETKAGVEQAVQKHKEKMGDRYVEIFLASSAHLRDALAGDGGGSRGRDQGGYGRGGQNYRNDEHARRDSGTRVGLPSNALRHEDYQSDFYAPNDVLYGGGAAPDQGPFRGGPSFAGYDHGMPVTSKTREPGFRLYMRGLPWTCSEKDIQDFFGEIKIKSTAKNVSDSNVFDGSAWVDFTSESDMLAAKRKHKSNMGHRYIELFSEQEVDEKRLGTHTSSRPGGLRGARSARGGREGAGPRGGGGARHATNRGGPHRNQVATSVAPNYGHVGNVGPRTPYDRPLQFQGQPTVPNSFGLVRQQGGFASYTSFQHQPILSHSSSSSSSSGYGYGNGNGGGGPPGHYRNNGGYSGNGGGGYGDGDTGWGDGGGGGGPGYSYAPGYAPYPAASSGYPPGPNASQPMHPAYGNNHPQYSQMPYGGPPAPYSD